MAQRTDTDPDLAAAKLIAFRVLGFLPPEIPEHQVPLVGAMLIGMGLGCAEANGHLVGSLEEEAALIAKVALLVARELAAI